MNGAREGGEWRTAKGVVPQVAAVGRDENCGPCPGAVRGGREPGGAGEPLKEGDKIRDTESGVDLEELVSQYIHGSVT